MTSLYTTSLNRVIIDMWLFML